MILSAAYEKQHKFYEYTIYYRQKELLCLTSADDYDSGRIVSISTGVGTQTAARLQNYLEQLIVS